MKTRYSTLAAAALALMFAAACSDTPTSPNGGVPNFTHTLPDDGSTQTCPENGDGWTKIDSGSGDASGPWGSFEYADETLVYDINAGYTIQFCVKSGSQTAGTDYEEVVGPAAGSIVVDQDISHVSWREVDDHTTTNELEALSVSKGATATYDRIVEWELDKTVDGEETVAFDGRPGQQFTVAWQVVATKTRDEETNFSVTGEITITNPNPVDVVVSVTDALDDETVASVDCGAGTASGTVPANGTLTCDYTAAPAGKTAILNTATVTVDSYDPPDGYTGTIVGGIATADVVFAENLIGDPNPLLADVRFEYEETITETTTLDRNETFTCSTDADDYIDGVQVIDETNTATLTGTNLDLSASATVTITCRPWDETATGFGSRYPKAPSNNWFMFTAAPASGGTRTVNLIAGQNYVAGTATLTDNGNGTTTITIALADGFGWANAEENLKVQPFASAPTKYASAGSFAFKDTFSGNEDGVIVVTTGAYYGIHADLLRFTP